MKKNKMKLTLQVMAQLGLIWRLNTSFQKKIAMMDEAMVHRRTLSLLL
jgi:UTP:GlnB (protein PII) uridylyltransferase